MNTSQKTNKHIFEHPERFTVCNLEFPCGDRFVGKIASCTFVGHQLTLVIERMVKVVETESGTLATQKEDKVYENYTLVFDGCRITENETSPTTTLVRSLIGDVIILSMDSDIVAEVIGLLEEQSVVK